MASRREFIRDSALTLTMAGTASLPTFAAAPLKQTRLVMAESFVFPEWLHAMQTAVSTTPADAAFWSAFSASSLQTQRHTLSGATDALTLLSLAAPGVELFKPAQARSLARLANDQLAARVRADRTRYAGLATVAAHDARAVYEAERAVNALGLSGISMGANRGLRLDSRSLWPLYEFAAAARVPIYLPATYAPMTSDVPYRALGRGGLLVGAAADSGEHAMQLIFGGVLDAFPNLTVVLARLGDATPHWYGRLNDTYTALRNAGAAHPEHSVEHYFQHNVLLTSADMSLPTLRFCSLMLNAGRVLATPEHSPSVSAPVYFAHSSLLVKTVA